jgi:single-stranded DNA-binding protein
MAADNTVTPIGNLTDDPELRLTANGAAVAQPPPSRDSPAPPG